MFEFSKVWVYFCFVRSIHHHTVICSSTTSVRLTLPAEWNSTRTDKCRDKFITPQKNMKERCFKFVIFISRKHEFANCWYTQYWLLDDILPFAKICYWCAELTYILCNVENIHTIVSIGFEWNLPFAIWTVSSPFCRELWKYKRNNRLTLWLIV